MVQWNTDWEGVHGFNDAAAELTAAFHPKGQEVGADLFAKISKYDDWLALTRAGYRAGTTLVLLLPFFKTWGLTDGEMQRYARDHLRIIPGAIETLVYVNKIMPVFIVSTTYKACMLPVIMQAGVPEKNLYCTQVDLGEYHFWHHEIREIERYAERIAQMPKMEWPKGASRKEDLSPEIREVAKQLDEIFFGGKNGLTKFGTYCRMINGIEVIGGVGKAEAISQSQKRTGNALNQVAFTDDSITGARGLELVRKSGGLAISVNGNEYAVSAADIVCLLNNALPLAALLTVFARGGKKEVFRLVRNWSWKALKSTGFEKDLMDKLHQAYPVDLPQVEIMDRSELGRLIKQSEDYRVYIRGEIGKLG